MTPFFAGLFLGLTLLPCLIALGIVVWVLLTKGAMT
jgi:hypothetical protein